jgi:hypothetical protein
MCPAMLLPITWEMLLSLHRATTVVDQGLLVFLVTIIRLSTQRNFRCTGCRTRTITTTATRNYRNRTALDTRPPCCSKSQDRPIEFSSFIMSLKSRLGSLAIVALAGFAVGYWSCSTSARVRSLQAKVDELSKRVQIEKTQPDTWKQASARSSGPRSKPEHLSPEELEEARAVSAREQDGEYMLQSERPGYTKHVQELIDKAVGRKLNQTAAEYQQVFSELGVNAEATAQLVTHISKIHKASRETEVSMQQLLLARNDFEERLHSLLPEDEYKRYKQYEESKPALREYENLQKFAASQNSPIDPSYEGRLAKLIQETKAYTQKSWHGPQDALPQPGIGKEMVLGQLQEEKNLILQRSQQLSNKARDEQLPELYQRVLQAYYADRMQQKERTMEALKKPVQEHSVPPSAHRPRR